MFTPKGDVISLPAGSVPIDFAYSIHSGVGNRMYGAKVNGRIVPLTYELQNGDIVEILTSDKVHGPSRDWMKIVKSSSARSKINQWFKKEMRDENIVPRQRDVRRELKKTGFTARQLLQQDFLDKVLRRFTLTSLDDMYASIGYGGISVGKILPPPPRRLHQEPPGGRAAGTRLLHQRARAGAVQPQCRRPDNGREDGP